MLIIVYIKNKKALLSKASIINGAILGFLLFMTYASQTIGLKYTSSGHSAFITGSAVVMAPLIMIFYFGHKISKRTAASIATVFIGLFMMTYDFKTVVNPGDWITLITALSYAIHIILAGRFVKQTEVLSLVTYQFLFTSLFALIGFLATAQNHTIELKSASVYSIIYLGLIGTLFCYFVFVWAQKHVSSIKVALVFSLEPVFAAMFAYLFKHETLNFKELCGGLVILIGVSFYHYMEYINKAYVEKIDP